MTLRRFAAPRQFGSDRQVKRTRRDVARESVHAEWAAAFAGLRCRRVVGRRSDLDEPILHCDLDAEAAEFAARLHLHADPYSSNADRAR